MDVLGFIKCGCFETKLSGRRLTSEFNNAPNFYIINTAGLSGILFDDAASKSGTATTERVGRIGKIIAAGMDNQRMIFKFVSRDAMNKKAGVHFPGHIDVKRF